MYKQNSSLRMCMKEIYCMWLQSIILAEFLAVECQGHGACKVCVYKWKTC